ncbi:hypothetical protein [Kineococcus arenarius]|uniref:hypothetical protein n=1 Tax=Kineococcus sp. SYSU DK021 TaxID=3383142 RepID=UPI003D7CC339
MNRRTSEGDAVDAHVEERAGAHPLRQPGAGRRLYAAGLGLQLGGVVGVLAAMVHPALTAAPELPAVVAWAPLLSLGVQLAGHRLCARAWWHVPLRSPAPLPDPVDRVFWTVFALAVSATAAVVCFAPARPEPTLVWSLAVAASLLALSPRLERPGPEPDADPTWRTVVLLLAVVAVLVTGVLAGLVPPRAASLALAVLGVAVVAQRAWLRHRYR